MTKYIILCYNKNTPVGYITYNNGNWNFTDDIYNKEDIYDSDFSDLIECLKTLMIITHYRKIKFDK